MQVNHSHSRLSRSENKHESMIYSASEIATLLRHQQQTQTFRISRKLDLACSVSKTSGTRRATWEHRVPMSGWWSRVKLRVWNLMAGISRTHGVWEDTSNTSVYKPHVPQEVWHCHFRIHAFAGGGTTSQPGLVFWHFLKHFFIKIYTTVWLFSHKVTVGVEMKFKDLCAGDVLKGGSIDINAI